jgi:hypothetical protein
MVAVPVPLTLNDSGDPQTFRNRWVGIIAGLVFGLGTLMGLVGLAAGITAANAAVTGYSGVLAGVSAYFTVRGVRSGVLVVSEAQVIARGFLRTRREELADIAGVSAVVGSVGLLSYQREFLRFAFRDGRTFDFKDLNFRPHAVGGVNDVVTAAALVSSRLVPAP